MAFQKRDGSLTRVVIQTTMPDMQLDQSRKERVCFSVVLAAGIREDGRKDLLIRESCEVLQVYQDVPDSGSSAGYPQRLPLTFPRNERKIWLVDFYLLALG